MGAATDAERVARAVRNPGRLVLGPTTTSGAFPYGGTSLGYVTNCELDWDVSYYENRDPASGAVSEISRSAEIPRIVCLVEGTQWDEDILAAVFAKTTASSTTSLSYPSSARIDGTLIPSVMAAWQPLLFAALDPTHNCVYFRRPVARLSLRQSVALAYARKSGLPIVFTPTPDADYATTPYWQVSKLELLRL